MFNEAHVSLTGFVATQPVTRVTGPGRSNLSMRVAWTERRRDPATGEWSDGNTSFVSVTCWRKLADNAATCLRKGDPVLIKGRLSVRDYQDRAGLQRTAVDVEAYSIGHDISRGVTQFRRVRPQTGLTATEYAQAADPDDSGQAPEPGAADGTGPAGGPAAEDIVDHADIAGLAASAEPVTAPF